jgi:hypothetical protein
MKKLILLAAASIVLCSAGFAGYKVYENQSMSPQDILLMQNLEALTRYEVVYGECEHGCAVNNLGRFCCTMLINGNGFALNLPWEG